MTLDSEFKYIATILATAHKRQTKVELYLCLKCSCLVRKENRTAHREQVHPKLVRMVQED